MRGLSLLLALWIVLVCRAEPPSDGTAGWPLADVEITSSPNVVTGRLENGLRYYIVPHASPSRGLSLRLLVEAGSLNENDNELGYAHFVEHMAFKGTTHFPVGELVRFLQRQGAQFGPHINAETTPTRTVYKLDLPESSPALLKTGLGIFRDFSDGILFEPAEVRRERGVILSEDHFRRTPEQAQEVALINFLYAGTRLPTRLPIGKPEQIERADNAALRRFYDAWYRPERLSVIVVGDVVPAEVEALVRVEFASLAARGEARYEPKLGKAAELTAPAIAVHPRASVGMDISLISVTDRPDLLATWGRSLKGMRIQAALSMLRQRLDVLVQKPDHVITGCGAFIRNDCLRFRNVTVSVAAAPDHLVKATEVVEQELRRALEFGFSAEEVVREQEIMRHLFREWAATVMTAPASSIASMAVDSVEDHAPLVVTAEMLDRELESIERLTANNCQSILQEFYGTQPLRIFVSCRAMNAPSEEAVRKALIASSKVVLTPPEQLKEIPFAYEDFGPAGVVVEKKHIEDLDLWQVQFANGVRANLKRTVFEAEKVRCSVRIGQGRLTEPVDQPGLGLWFPFLWYGGTGKHSVNEFGRFLGGLTGITLTSEDDAFVIRNELPSANLSRSLHQLTAIISDPAFRPEGWEQARAALRGQTSPLWTRPEGVVSQLIRPRLAGGDLRVGIPSDEKYMARTPEQFRSWLAPQLATGPIELSLVGDFDPQVAIEELSRTFGTLASRQPRGDQTTLARLNFLQDRKALAYTFEGAADRSSRLAFYWRIRDSITPREVRLLKLLAEIMGNRVRDEIREKKGETYATDASFFASDVYPGFAFIACSVDLMPDVAEKHGRTVRRLALKLAENGVTADELARAKALALAATNRERTDNTYWRDGVLADCQQRPFRLDAARSAEKDIATATIAELNNLAARYLGPDRVFNYLIKPDGRKKK